MLKIKKVRKQQKWQIFDTDQKKVIKEFDSLEKAKEFVKSKKTITKKTEQLIKEQQRKQKAPKTRGGGRVGGRGYSGAIRYQQIDEALLQRKLMELQQKNQAIQQKDLDNSRREIMKERFGYTEQQANEVLNKGQEAYDRTQGTATQKSKAREAAEHKVQIDILADQYRDQLENDVPAEILSESLTLAKERANMTSDPVIANNAFIQKLSNEIRRRQGNRIVNLPPLNEETAPVYYLPKSVYGGKLFNMTKYLTPDAESYRGRFSSSRAEGVLRDTLPKTPMTQEILQIKDKTVEEINAMFSEMNRRREATIKAKPKEPTPTIEDVPMIDPDEQIQATTNVQDKRPGNDAGNNTAIDPPMRKTLNKTGTRLMDRLIKSFETYNVDPVERAGALTVAEEEYEARGAKGLQDHIAQVIRRFKIQHDEAIKELENSGIDMVSDERDDKRKAEPDSGSRKKKRSDEPVVEEPVLENRQQILSETVEPPQFSLQEPQQFSSSVGADAFAFPQFVGPNVPKEVPFRAPIRRKKKIPKASMEQIDGPVLSESEQQFLSNQAMAREEELTRKNERLSQILQNPETIFGIPRDFQDYKSRRLALEGQQPFEYYEPKGPKEERRRKQPSVYDPSSVTSIVPFGQVNQSSENQLFGEPLEVSRTAFE